MGNVRTCIVQLADNPGRNEPGRAEINNTSTQKES
jgi:hydroxypyruvate isomerase